MKLLKVAAVLVVLAGLVAVVVFAPSAVGAQERRGRGGRDVTILAGRGAAIGVSVRDLEPAEADRQKAAAGVLVDDVRPGSPADKAGIKRSDIIVEFDGEHVRSARQFSRLVQETPTGRTVKASVLRDGQRKDVSITTESRSADLLIDRDRIFERLGDLEHLAEALPPFNFDAFDFDVPNLAGRRLGVAVETLTDQLGDYFGAREGVLVRSVNEGSPAAKAGVKAGDVITSINGDRIRSRDDFTRTLRDAERDGRRNESLEVTIGIVRDKKESTVKATLEPRWRTMRGRPA